MEQIIQEMKSIGIQDVRVNEPLSRHTTWKVGGPADLLIYPRNKEELEQAMQVVYRHQIPWRVIGRGSNLLVRDGGIRGVVFKLDEGFNELKVDGTRVTAGGGYSTILLATMTSRQGLTGLEFAAGIPGNVGGAVYMNAGAHGSDISKVLHSATVLLETGEWVTLSNEEMEFRYRTSVLQTKLKGIVTEASFTLEYGERDEIMSRLTSYKDRRRKTQPLQYPCAGSVFRNPPGDYAGRLIQEAGLKGFRIGDAEVSTTHANFIINRGNATAKNVLQLIEHIIQTIDEKYNIRLEPEVQVVGEE
ncbi:MULTISPECIES: UDP-N-acetylmuramate dehydrogenase [Thermoactinomyces]|uniref:UDP-N-acetylenolpyruvoylglucosamine reductase n=1 Tax=Thermoactinomyces vulgaris TaxID=2026 RepID=A0ABS0QI15_THEVU|nr:MULTISPECIES: UDP-N-acetylmuramate dehydrogenase [Thermoactinomyces]MBH8582820.1 UDP-N-acetylmuramate dehydrogenase [Thermoactinomyces sp. CICC 10735]MBH8585611.1 UDP-N-acetylmuramate dehydrogenase [Thermoactinomyces sp. CICC 10520]MBI0391665.1 UDP-N-acetylmuramate dehydrogenase [Thermoactinomyces sp. CICC 24226]KFZ40645.1 UDP-N-acetylenolpyruvoylglucosamine reductase [Thermoactinomyces sp. Gus2-1]KYQ86957.1 UDP-N-acetylenolpyruvoylglucosamine reductase [Thermoactinomyces sp. AS95]